MAFITLHFLPDAHVFHTRVLGFDDFGTEAETCHCSLRLLFWTIVTHVKCWEVQVSTLTYNINIRQSCTPTWLLAQFQLFCWVCRWQVLCTDLFQTFIYCRAFVADLQIFVSITIASFACFSNMLLYLLVCRSLDSSLLSIHVVDPAPHQKAEPAPLIIC